MKGLLSLSKQRKQSKKPEPNKINHWSNGNDDLDQSEEKYDEEEDYQPTQQQIIQYAQYIGIDPIKQRQLLHIAKEGLITPVPPPWQAIETKGGDEIIYINKQTGERTFEHPCDQLFRQIVIQQRRKMKPAPKVSSQGVLVAPLKPQVHQPTIHNDPLLQLEQQRKRKKQQEQNKQKFIESKKQLQQKFKKQEQQIKQQYLQKQNRLKDQYRRQQEEVREKNRSKANEKQKQDHLKINRQLQQFKDTLRKQLEGTLQQRLKFEKESLTLIYNNKKQQSRRNLQQQYKRKKKDAEEDCNSRLKQIENRQSQIRQQAAQLSKRLNKELQIAKEQIIQKSLQEHKHRIQQHRIKEQKRLQQQCKKLEQLHVQKLNKLSTEPVTQNNISSAFSLQHFISQLEKNQQSKLKALKYEMQAFRSLRKSQIQNQLLQYESELQRQHQNHLKQIQKESQIRIQNDIKKLQRQIKLKTSQLQKTANDDYLRSLQDYEKVYNKQQGDLVGHYKNSRLLKNQEVNQDNLTLKRLENQYQDSYKQSINLKKQLQKLKLEYETSKQQLEAEENEKGPLSRILNEQQRRIYDRLTDMNQRIINERRELELKQLM